MRPSSWSCEPLADAPALPLTPDGVRRVLLGRRPGSRGATPRRFGGRHFGVRVGPRRRRCGCAPEPAPRRVPLGSSTSTPAARRIWFTRSALRVRATGSRDMAVAIARSSSLALRSRIERSSCSSLISFLSGSCCCSTALLQVADGSFGIPPCRSSPEAHQRHPSRVFFGPVGPISKPEIATHHWRLLRRTGHSSGRIAGPSQWVPTTAECGLHGGRVPV